MNTAGPYRPDAEGAGRRALKNACLDLLATTEDDEAIARAFAQYQGADNMTDRMAALETLALHDRPERAAALDDFYRRYADDPLIIDKWLALQAIIPEPATLDRVRALTGHPAFSMANPNRVRALIGAFAQANHTQFNRLDGAGYDFVADIVLKLDPKNPQVAARMMGAFRSWRALEAGAASVPRRRCGVLRQRPICRPTSTTSSPARWPIAEPPRRSGSAAPIICGPSRATSPRKSFCAQDFCASSTPRKSVGQKLKKYSLQNSRQTNSRHSNGVIRGRCGTLLRNGSRGSSETEEGMARAETASASYDGFRSKGWHNRLPTPRIGACSPPSRCCAAPFRFSSSPSC